MACAGSFLFRIPIWADPRRPRIQVPKFVARAEHLINQLERSSGNFGVFLTEFGDATRDLHDWFPIDPTHRPIDLALRANQLSPSVKFLDMLRAAERLYATICRERRPPARACPEPPAPTPKRLRQEIRVDGSSPLRAIILAPPIQSKRAGRGSL